jgi:hypothetical protein
MWVNAWGGFRMPHRAARFLPNIGLNDSPSQQFFEYQASLLRSTGAELKIMQELLRHSTIRVTLDTYTQAVTAEKRNAQEAVVALLFREKTRKT